MMGRKRKTPHITLCSCCNRQTSAALWFLSRLPRSVASRRQVDLSTKAISSSWKPLFTWKIALLLLVVQHSRWWWRVYLLFCWKKGTTVIFFFLSPIERKSWNFSDTFFCMALIRLKSQQQVSPKRHFNLISFSYHTHSQPTIWLIVALSSARLIH